MEQQLMPTFYYHDFEKVVRSDMYVATIRRNMAGLFDLPVEAVQIVLPSGDYARYDLPLGDLRDYWKAHIWREEA
jgi:hypothetical protein